MELPGDVQPAWPKIEQKQAKFGPARETRLVGVALEGGSCHDWSRLGRSGVRRLPRWCRRQPDLDNRLAGLEVG
jgi:hypothetical protein